MSGAHKLILEKANAAIVQGDFEGFLMYCTEDTAWTFEGDRTMDIALAGFYMAYAFGFNWCCDIVFPVRQARRRALPLDEAVAQAGEVPIWRWLGDR